MIGRREFITLLGGAIALPVIANSQEKAPPKKFGPRISRKVQSLQADTSLYAVRSAEIVR
jgi:hypothetical protein